MASLAWLGWLMAAMAASFIVRRSFLALPFYADDLYFIHHAAHSAGDFAAFLSPNWGWLYRPVFLWYFSALYAVTHNPVAFHAGSLLIHGLVLWLLGLLAYRLSRRFWLGVAATIVFLWWPSKTEAVWWISCTSTLLATLFYLATLHLWLSWRETNCVRYFVVALGAAALALCSKNDAISLPIALLLLDWYRAVPYAQQMRRRALEWAPVVLITLGYLFLEWTAGKVYSATGDTGMRAIYHVSAGDRLKAIWVFWYATLKPALEYAAVPLERPGLPALLVIGALAATLWQAREHPWFRLLCVAFAWAVFASIPVPLASGGLVTASRFFYLPLLPVALLVPLTAALLWAQCRERQPSAIVMSLALAVMVAMRYLPLISDPPTLWTYLLVIMGASALLWHEGVATWRTTAIVAAVAIGSQLSSFMPLANMNAWLYVTLAACALCAPSGTRWQSSLLAYLCFTNPALLPVLAVTEWLPRHESAPATSLPACAGV